MVLNNVGNILPRRGIDFGCLSGGERNAGADGSEVESRLNRIPHAGAHQAISFFVVGDRAQGRKKIQESQLKLAVQIDLIHVSIEPFELTRHLAVVEENEPLVGRCVTSIKAVTVGEQIAGFLEISASCIEQRERFECRGNPAVSGREIDGGNRSHEEHGKVENISRCANGKISGNANNAFEVAGLGNGPETGCRALYNRLGIGIPCNVSIPLILSRGPNLEGFLIGRNRLPERCKCCPVLGYGNSLIHRRAWSIDNRAGRSYCAGCRGKHKSRCESPRCDRNGRTCPGCIALNQES